MLSPPFIRSLGAVHVPQIEFQKIKEPDQAKSPKP
jgi:hypothetical protein